jgi:hypothetical protein
VGLVRYLWILYKVCGWGCGFKSTGEDTASESISKDGG